MANTAIIIKNEQHKEIKKKCKVNAASFPSSKVQLQQFISQLR